MASQSRDSRPHAGACREAVVDQDDRLALDLRRRPLAAIEPLPPSQLLLLARSDRVDERLGDAERLDELLVQHSGTAARDRPHRQLLLPRQAELADEEDVE